MVPYSPATRWDAHDVEGVIEAEAKLQSHTHAAEHATEEAHDDRGYGVQATGSRSNGHQASNEPEAAPSEVL